MAGHIRGKHDVPLQDLSIPPLSFNRHSFNLHNHILSNHFTPINKNKKPLYIYLSFAILIGLFAGLILYGISEVIQACLDKVSTYFGASVPLYRRTGPTAAAQTSLLMMKQKSSEFGDSYIHDWMDIEDEHWAMGSGSGSGSGSGTGTDYHHHRRTDGTSEEEEEDETRRRRNLQAKKSRVLWRSPPAWELALFPLSRMEELDRDEPNYDSEEEEGE